ncbi:DUF2784 domain-containing protein [Polymorphospora sp. NPDC051019]|uniref:DUF2784 domain-containing protein n=1 Tax=Polymorphospora sp. NPDC051019 TaxID=3155725 RepID=UPI003418034B
MGYELLTTVILVLHFAFVAYVVLGGFIAWRWPRTFWAHAVAASWGLIVVAAGLTCPLTTAEAWSRRQAGESGYTGGFIDRYIEGVLYPERFTPLVQALVAVAVLGSWAVLLLRRRAASRLRADQRR